MARLQRATFATQVDPKVLEAVRDLARQEGRQLQALVEEVLSGLIEKRRQARPGLPSWRFTRRATRPLPRCTGNWLSDRLPDVRRGSGYLRGSDRSPRRFCRKLHFFGPLWVTILICSPRSRPYGRACRGTTESESWGWHLISMALTQ